MFFCCVSVRFWDITLFGTVTEHHSPGGEPWSTGADALLFLDTVTRVVGAHDASLGSLGMSMMKMEPKMKLYLQNAESLERIWTSCISIIQDAWTKACQAYDEARSDRKPEMPRQTGDATGKQEMPPVNRR